MTGRAILIPLLVSSVGSAQSPGQAAAPEPFELPRVLTLQAALQLFRERGLDLLIADAAVQSAEGEARIARAVPNLAINGSFGKSLDCSEGACKFIPDPVLGAGLSDQSALGAILVGKISLRTQVAEAALGAAKMSRNDAQRTLESQLKQQFEQVLVAQDAVNFAREVQQSTTRMLELSATRYRAGAISEADLARVETTKLEADQGVNVVEQVLRLAQVSLALLLGVRSEIPDFVAEQPELLHYSVPPPLADISPKSLLADALAHRPDLQALRFQRARAEAAISLAKRLRVPDFALSLQYTQQGN
ncbi:MAG TPA: TolC family protein, partial [Myxococcaceae bacterium]|nr:TolC family protein [Myxococcaceae bacterium]